MCYLLPKFQKFLAGETARRAMTRVTKIAGKDPKKYKTQWVAG